MASPAPTASNPSLPATITFTLTSITTTIELINTPPADPTVVGSKTYASVPLYAFLADIANLTKAHSTKLGLISNPPIVESSHSAIIRILLDVTNSILPVAASAPYIASKARYGSITHGAVVKGIVDMLRGFEEMVKAIENNISGDTAEAADKDKGKRKEVPKITDLRQSTAAASKSSYTSTGQIWFSADTLLSISQNHLIGLVEAKLKSHADMLNDCIAEFKDWVADVAEELNGEDSGFDEDESQSNSFHADLGQDDDFFGLEGEGKAKATKEVLATAEATQKKLKLISILYTAILKRRVKDPSTRLGGVYTDKRAAEGGDYTIEKEKNADRLERLVDLSNKLVEKADDLAAGFYDGEEIGFIMGLRNEVVRYATEIAEVCKLDREGREDPPTTWFGKFIENIRT
ncbi:hypothetical protein ABW19_dt0208244 [Dactylella cylindrospora]|nr:hypothetical protein ABW19_dt0208244 [Dactylella cylindrospora]